MDAEPGLTRVELGDDPGYEVLVAAPPDAVFQHWTVPDLLVRWMGDVATLDPEPGGIFRLEYQSGHVASGSYAVVDRPRRLAFTWGWEAEPDFPPASSTIELSFEPLASGGTLMGVRHTGMPAELRANVDEGWGYFLPRLVDAAAGA